MPKLPCMSWLIAGVGLAAVQSERSIIKTSMSSDPASPTRRSHFLLVMRGLGLTYLCPSATAQQTVFLCNGTYTDQPCKGGREINVLPTERAAA